MDSVNRFTGLAGIYARHRPAYASAALDFIFERCNLGPGSLLVDVGSGTGISSRQFASRGLRVIGIEPNADMRKQAAAEPMPAGLASPVYQEGQADRTGLPAGLADAVLAAQAFHWFAGAETLVEFQRILKPEGWLIVLANERDDSDAFTAAYGDVIRTVQDGPAVEARRNRVTTALAENPYFVQRERVTFANEQALDETGLVGRAFSVSYAPRDPEAAAAHAGQLRDLFGRFQQEGQVVLRYQTVVVLGQSTSTSPAA